jgi:hypothetical protein
VSRLFRIEILIAVVVLGYLVGLPFLLWGIQDARLISRRVWAAVGRRRSRWEHQLILAWLLLGWPVIPIVMTWKRSRLRIELHAEKAVERDRGRY